MTHSQQRSNLPAAHTPACTAAPGPCICTNLTADTTPGPGRLSAVTLDPDGRDIIGIRDTALENTTTITEEDGTVLAVFDEDGTLTGGKLFRTLNVYRSLTVAARNENRALSKRFADQLESQRRKDRSTRRTIITLTIMSISGWGYGLARGLGWF